MRDCDAVVIGAGNAGLTAAATLQRAGVSTLLIERHNVPGGCATSFRRGRFEFETALHQLSGLGHEGQAFSLRGLFDALGVSDRIEFVEEHDLYRAVVPGVVDLTLPADLEGAINAIEEGFPGNGDRARKFFDLVRQVAMWQVAAMRMPAEQIDPVLFRQGLRPTKEVFDEYFDDAGLKHALGAYWGYLGQPPEKLPFQDMATLLFAYLEYKPWHIRGGSQAMSAAIFDAFIAAGGQALFNTEVEQILVRDGHVAGVRLDDGQEIATRDVVSNSSLPATYEMLEGIAVPEAVSKDLGTRRIGVSAFVLHMGLNATPAELGFTTSTSFVNANTDDLATYESWRTLQPARGICLTSYDVAPIGFAPSGTTHVSLLTLQYASAWEGLDPADYHRTKFAYAQTLLDLSETVVPDIRDAIEEIDVATPMTMMHYLGHPGGAIYGYDQDATENWLFRTNERRPQVPGLHLAGSWTGMGGFQPTLQAGFSAARRLLRSQAA